MLHMLLLLNIILHVVCVVVINNHYLLFQQKTGTRPSTPPTLQTLQLQRYRIERALNYVATNAALQESTAVASARLLQESERQRAVLLQDKEKLEKRQKVRVIV